MRGAIGPPGPAPYAHANGSGNGNDNGVVGRIADLGNDMFTLGELQARLVALDLKDCTGKAAVPLAGVVIGAATLFAALMVGMLGVVDLVAYALNVRQGWAMLITAAFASAVAGLLVFVCTRRLSASLTPLRRSREEFQRNLAWVRTVLVHSGRPVTKRSH
jgi:hypothetical protein